MNENSNHFNKFTLPLFWVFSFVVIIFMISMTAYASSPDFPLPYYVDYYQSAYFSDSFTPISNYTADSNTFYWVTERPNLESWPTIAVFKGSLSDMRILGFYNYDKTQTVNPEDFDFNTDFVKISFTSNVRYDRYYYNGSWTYWSGGSGSLSVENQYFLGRSSENMTSLGYTNLVPFLLGSDVSYDGVTIFTNGVPTIPDDPINAGIAVVPPQGFFPEYLQGETAPTNVPPSYTINNYTWTTAPLFDNSSVISGIQSIKNTLEWLSENLHNELSNLLYNLKGLATYIGETIQYYGNAIIQTLNNLIQNFYDNMKALVENIGNQIAYIIELPDINEINASFTSTNFYGVKQQFMSVFTSFENAFDITEPNTFTLVINIQNIDTFYNFGCRSPVIIHLDQHFTPIKTALRTFLWIVISFSTVFVVEKGLSNWLRGERKE